METAVTDIARATKDGESITGELAAAAEWRKNQDEKTAIIQQEIEELSKQVTQILNNQEAYQRAIEKRNAVQDANRENFFADKWNPLLEMVQDVRRISSQNTNEIANIKALTSRVDEKVTQLSTELERVKGRVDQIEKAQSETRTNSKVSDTKLAIMAGILIFLAPQIMDRLFPKSASTAAQTQAPIIYVVPQGSQPQAVQP